MNWMTILNLVLAIIILLIIGSLMYLRYVKNLDQELDKSWFKLLLKVRKRSDMIPLIIEKSKMHFENMSFKNLLKKRAEAMNNSRCTGSKVNAELALSEELNKLLKEIDNDKSAQKDILLLNMKKELFNQSELIEMDLEKYNEKVRYYNKLVSSKYLPFLVSFLKLRRRNIFEFEA
ncbi:hypothetical protein GF376_03245 [Candidatus Peregrinibacteria bacterium]|nr:hypothetical protein [Candidatus Peregrinibacteria bacterium]